MAISEDGEEDQDLPAVAVCEEFVSLELGLRLEKEMNELTTRLTSRA